jgi:hypothetical protein
VLGLAEVYFRRHGHHGTGVTAGVDSVVAMFPVDRIMGMATEAVFSAKRERGRGGCVC